MLKPIPTDYSGGFPGTLPAYDEIPAHSKRGKVYAVEEEFGVMIPDEIAMNFETVGDMFNYIHTQTQ